MISTGFIRIGISSNSGRRSNIAPFWRAFFAYFFCYQCFDEIRGEARNLGLTPLAPAGPLAAGWIIATLVWKLPDPYDFLSLFSFVFILPVQVVANRINSIATPHHEVNQRFTALNWWGISLGAVAIIEMIFRINVS